MTFIPLTGASSGGSKPSNWTVRERLRNITKALTAGSSLDLRFAEKFFYQQDNLYPAMELMATHSRTSSAWYPNWDFKSGSEVGRLVEYGADERRYGDYGALDEGASTNQTSNARLEGAVVGVVGAGGAVPTGLTNAQGPATLEVLGSGVESGWPYVELEYTTTGSAFPQLYFGTLSSYSAASGETWTTSCGLRLLDSSGGFLGLQVKMREYDGVTITNDTLTSAYVAADSAHRRFKHTATLTGGTTDNALGGLLLGFSGAGFARFRLYVPQFEEAADATSPILPTAGTPAAATRAADIVSGVTTDRASRGWYDTQWDYTDGGLVGDLLEFLPGVPRVGPKGLLVEEGTTNHIRNPRAEGAVAGAPGTLPTNWTFSMPGITHEVVGSGFANGKPYIDLKFAGTPTGDGFLYYESSTVVSAASGQTWTLAVDMSVVDGDLSNMDGIRIVLTERTSVGGNNGQNSSVEKTPDALPRRFYHTATLSNGTTAHVQPMMELEWTGSGNIDFTLRLSLPSLEQAAYPTSVVLPEAGSPAAATRAAGAPYMELPAGFDPARGFAFLWEFTPLAASNPTTFGGLGDTFDNTVYAASANGDLYVHIRSAGATVASFNLGQLTTGEQVRLAVSLADNNLIASRSGSASLVDTSGAPPQSIARLKLGGGPWSTTGSAQGASHQSFRLFGAALQQADLEALVA